MADPTGPTDQPEITAGPARLGPERNDGNNGKSRSYGGNSPALHDDLLQRYWTCRTRSAINCTVR